MAKDEDRVQIDDRRKANAPGERVAEDRRAGSSARRVAPRIKTFKGAQIVSPGALSLKCIVRNISKTGAQIEVQRSVGDAFELVFDDSATPPQTCRVVWRDYPRVGVSFDATKPELGPVGRALSQLPKKLA